MLKESRKITVFADIDGTQNYLAPPPLKTALALFRNKFVVPPKTTALKEAEPRKGAGRILSLFFHAMRPFSRNSEEGLELFEQLIRSGKRLIKLVAISGRGPELHEMTRNKLVNSGRMKYFREIHLSCVNSASGFKERKIRQEVAVGNAAVLIEDDLLSALRVARINKDHKDIPVLIYLLRNLTNARWLRRRGNINLPQNILLVGSFREAAENFAKKIRENLL